MSVLQKNINEDSVIYTVSPDFSRQLTNELQAEIIFVLTELNIATVEIQFEYSADTAEFASFLSYFLSTNGYVFCEKVSMKSEMKKNEFSIQIDPSDSLRAIIRIGS